MITDLSIHDSLSVHGLPAIFAKSPLTQMVQELWKDPRRDLLVRYAARLKQGDVPFEAPLLLGRADKGKSFAAAIAVRTLATSVPEVRTKAWMMCGSFQRRL